MTSRRTRLSDNYEWYIRANTRMYAGKWIGIVDQKIVASGDDAEKVYRAAKRRFPAKKPSIAKVPSKDILVLTDQQWQYSSTEENQEQKEA